MDYYTLSNSDNSLLLQKLIDRTELNSNELAVLELRYCHKTTLKSIGIELGLSPERIRQIEAKVLRKFRRTFNLLSIGE